MEVEAEVEEALGVMVPDMGRDMEQVKDLGMAVQVEDMVKEAVEEEGVEEEVVLEVMVPDMDQDKVPDMGLEVGLEVAKEEVVDLAAEEEEDKVVARAMEVALAMDQGMVVVLE